MEVTETLAEGLTREFKIIIPAAELDAELNSRLVELAPQVSLPGFRPGKVPPSLLRQRYGDSLLGEIIEKSVNENTQKTLEERDLRVASQPRIEITSYDKGKDLEYTVSLELMPDIGTLDYAKLSLERVTAEVGEDQIKEALDRMASQQKESSPVEKARPAATGDVVVIDFEGKIDGEVFEGGAGQDHHLELGSDSFIPGFEEQLIGIAVGETKDVPVPFPADYPAAHLAGKEAVFTVTAKELREPAPVEINDAFAQRFGMDSLDALKAAVKEQIEGEFGDASRARLKRSLLDALAEKYSFDVPPGMVEEEYRGIVHQVVHHAEGDKGASDDHDHDHGKEHDHNHDHDHGDDHNHAAGHEADEAKLSEEDRAEFRSIATRRVRLGLLLSEVGRQNSIQVTDDEVQRAIQQQASRFPGQEKFVFEYYQKNPQALAQVRAPLFEDKVVDFMVEMAKVTDTIVSAEALFADPDADEAPADGEEKPKPKAAAKPTAKAKSGAKSEDTDSKATPKAKAKPKAKKADADKGKES
ncbi:MAG: trigger factor [Alphaproteobacteria bacterium]|nr:trigger factor [Alphaproteobacteria bacterium]